MSYVDDVCYSLIRVLDHASLHSDVRLAGYAPNLDFWVEEVRHCLDCLAGYDARQTKLIDARQRYAAEHNLDLEPALITPSTTDNELRKLEMRLKSSSQKFLKLCCKHQYIDFKRQKEIEQLLGIRINYKRNLD